MITFPPHLKKGDTIGIVCPAGFMPLEKAQTCIDTLQEWGFTVAVGRTLGGSSQTYFSGTDDERLSDLQEMLDNKSIDAILFGRGGYGLGRIIDDIRFRKFRKNPKWLVGFSDITVLHAHVYSKYKIATMHAPMAAAFNDGGSRNEFVHSIKAALLGESAYYKAGGHHFNKPGIVSGELVGGNLSLLAHLIGTPSELKTKNRILFLEDIGEYAYNVDRMMYQLKRSGGLKNLAGLIIGGFTDMKDTDRPFGKPVYDIIHEIVKGAEYPVCFGFPVSHDKENYALKIGGRYTLTVTKDEVVLTEGEKF